MLSTVVFRRNGFISDMDTKQTYGVLVVDDSEDDRLLLRHTIAKYPRFKLLGELGVRYEAVDYLLGHGIFAQRTEYPFPDLLLLDLKMPKMTGYDVLTWLRTQTLPSLTVAVLSGSTLPEDVQTSLALGAHGYWSKTAVPREVADYCA